MQNVSRAGLGLYIILIEVALKTFGITVPDGTIALVLNDIVQIVGIGLLIWGQIARKDLVAGILRR